MGRDVVYVVAMVASILAILATMYFGLWLVAEHLFGR